MRKEKEQPLMAKKVSNNTKISSNHSSNQKGHRGRPTPDDPACLTMSEADPPAADPVSTHPDTVVALALRG